MINLKTKINPYQFEKELGKLIKIYTTTISSFAYVLLIYSIIIFTIGIVQSFKLIEIFNSEFFLWIGITILTLSFSIYLSLAIRYSYVATFKNGMVIKKRFKTIVVANKEIKKNEFRNLSILYNYFRSDNSKRLAIDIFLKNDKIISIGESYRIFKLISYPRILGFTKIWDIKL